MILFKQYKSNFNIYFKKLIYKRIDFYHLDRSFKIEQHQNLFFRNIIIQENTKIIWKLCSLTAKLQ